MDEGHTQHRKHAVVTGGGSAGHVHPGLAVARELIERGWSVSWMGRAGSFEQRLVAGAQVEFDAVPALPVVGRGLLGKTRAGVVVLRGAHAARKILKRRKAQTVIGTGGYVSVPGVLAAKMLGRRVLLFEPNAVMGVGNRLLACFADRIAWGHPGPQTGGKNVVTGVPVNESFSKVTQSQGTERNCFQILVLGGSQGSEELNQVVPKALMKLAPTLHRGLAVLHQCGSQHEAVTQQRYQQVAASVEVVVRGFLSGVAGHMKRSDLVISRAGAQTLAELAAAGRAAILVPLMIAHGHQESNAKRLVERGAAWSSPHPSAEQLAERLTALLSDPSLVQIASQSMAEQATPRAAAHIADLVEALEEAA